MADTPVIIQRIRKLLSLGQSANQHESERALMKAKELAVSYQLDLAQFTTQAEWEEKQEEISKGAIVLGKRLPTTHRFIVDILQGHFNVHVIWGWEYDNEKKSHQRRISLVGKTSDIQIGTYVYTYLNDTFFRLWREYKDKVGAQTDQRNSYFYGLYHGLSDKLTEKAKETEKQRLETIASEQGQEQAQAVEQRYALMKVSDTDRLKSKVKEFFPRVRSVRTHYFHNHSHDAMQDGIKHGKTINIAMPLGAGKAVPQLT